MYSKLLYTFSITALLLIIAAGNQSCKKWLAEKPYSLYAVETYFTIVDDAEKAVLGVYEVMSNRDYYGFNVSLVFDIDSDLGQMEGPSLSNDNRTLAHYNVTPGHRYIAATWTLIYKGIDRANLVIQKIPEMNLYNNGTQTQKKELKRLLAEAKFLRGLFYFDLIRFFGDVPFKLTPTKASDNMNLGKTDREQIYDQIIKDMSEAIPDIPWHTEKTLDERTSKGAAKGILARIYLGRAGYSLRQDGTMKRPENYKEYYSAALKETNEIIQSGQHELNASYENIFRNYCALKLEPKESMFEIAFFNTTGNDPNSGYIGSWNSPLCHTNSSYGRANSFYKTTPLFQKSYASGDLRKDVAVATFQISAANEILQYTGSNERLWSPGKWRRNWQNTSPKNVNNTDINWVLLRYADVLLMKAEAENEVNDGPNAEAYNAINMVRRRGFGLPLNTTSSKADLPTGLSKQAFSEKIQTERAFELCFEGFRKFDLIRWNILGISLRNTQAALKAYRNNFPYVAGNYFADNKHELYPIPVREIELAQNLVQNPNY